jgi:tetratricopeptide (TPR) repeat protein
MEQPTDWIPALVVLALGVVIGLFVYWRSSRREPLPVPGEVALEVRDHQARFDALIQQLRELDDLASKRTPEQLERERRALETEAALALRELAAIPQSHPRISSDAALTEQSAPADRPRSILPGFLWGAGTVFAIAILAIFVTRGSFDRPEGGSLTGGSMSPAPQTAAGSPVIDLGGLQQAVARNPDDLEARLDLAQAMLINQDIAGVADQTRQVLARDPDNPRALSYGSLVELASGNTEAALRMAERSIEGDPSNPETWVHLALIQVQNGSATEAESTMREAIVRFPADAAALQGILTELVPSAAEVPAAAVENGVIVDLETGRRAGGTVFIFIYPYGSDDPVAVRRESIQSLPARLALGAADLMTGSALPEEMRIVARLDGDGVARTREPGDFEGSATGVRPGSSIRIRMEPLD